MPAYVIAEFDVIDEDKLKKYSELAFPAMTAHHGRLLFSGEPERAEGNWPADRTVAVFEFPTMAELGAWYTSSEYARAHKLASTAMRRNLLFLESDTSAA